MKRIFASLAVVFCTALISSCKQNPLPIDSTAVTEDTEAALGKELVIYDRLHCYFESWGEDCTTVIVTLKSANGGDVGVGKLMVYLTTGKMTVK